MEEIIITIRPTPKQHLAYQKLWDSVTRFLLFGGGAEGGKSWLGAEWLLQNCYRYPGSKWFIGRNELTRAMGSSYATFRKVCQHHSVPQDDWKFNGQYHYIEFRNPDSGLFDGLGSRIDLIDLKFQPQDPLYERFGSFEYTGGWIEEAGEVNFLAFDVLKARVGRWKNDEFGLPVPKILLTCNPKQNWLYRMFYKPWRKFALPPEYSFIQALYKDNIYTAKEAEQRLDQISDPVMRMRLKMGLWEYTSDDNSLVKYDDLLDLFTNSPAPVPVNQETPRYLTADVARYGSDRVVFGNWKDLELYKITAKEKRGIDQTALDVKEELKVDRIPYSHAIADDDGVGGGVVDIARGIKGFVGNSSPLQIPDPINEDEKKKENYKNLRSQCGFMLADRITNHRIAITAKVDEVTKEMIIEDLQQLLKRKETKEETVLQIISKEEIKEALGRSPDYGDMMLMRMYFLLDQPTPKFKQSNQVGGVGWQ